jgi:UDP-N-acetylmuramate--alanine ligase
MNAFGPALAQADHVVLTDIYPASEAPIPGVTIEALATAIRKHVSAPVDVVPHVGDVAAALGRLTRPGDVVITLGAGSIGTVAEQLVQVLVAERGSGKPPSGARS